MSAIIVRTSPTRAYIGSRENAHHAVQDIVGMEDGIYEVNGQPYEVRDGKIVRQPSDFWIEKLERRNRDRNVSTEG